MCAGCLMFLFSLFAISALGVIAGGAFWTAQAVYRITDAKNSFVDVKMCCDQTYNNCPVSEYCDTLLTT